MKQWAERLKALCSSGNGMKLIVAIGLAGMALILLSELLPEKDAAPAPQPAASADAGAETDYADALTAQLTALLTKITGVGHAEVMVTLAGSSETVYAEEQNRETNERGSRTENQYVIIGSGSNQSALVKSSRYPRVSGVIVVCEGGDSSVVREQVYRAVAVACGVSSAQIYVAALRP